MLYTQLVAFSLNKQNNVFLRNNFGFLFCALGLKGFLLFCQGKNLQKGSFLAFFLCLGINYCYGSEVFSYNLFCFCFRTHSRRVYCYF